MSPLDRTAVRRAGLLLVTALIVAPACSDRRRTHHADPIADAGAADPTPIATQTRDAGAEQDLAPWLVASVQRGAATMDTTLRIHMTGAGGAPQRPGGGAPGRAPVVAGAGLFPGDVVFTGAASSLALQRLSGSPSESVALGDDAIAEIPGYGGALLVLSLGIADITASTEPLRIDTPAGRVIVSGGSATVGVAGDASVAVLSGGGVVTMWPSPSAPETRRTRLTAAEIALLHRTTQGHPLLLDVNLPDLAAQAARPVSAVAMTPGEVLAWDPLGSTHRHGPTARANRAAVVRWVVAQNALVARPNAHLVAIGLIGRAGGGDVADARAVVARLRADGASLPPQTRNELINALSLALGRATARARRGRDLAGRGGDVTALVQLAPTEDVRDSARALLPLEP